MIDLKKADRSDCEVIHRIHVKAFSPILLKYQDYDSNPASESLDDIYRRFDQSFTDYYLIELDGSVIGSLRVCDFGASCRLSPICILPEFQGNGYAQRAILLAEQRHGADHWSLETILQEPGLGHLYEKMGYRKTGKTKVINDKMTLIFYEKENSL